MRKGWLDMPEEYFRELIMLMKENKKISSIVVAGTSMEPTIKQGAVLNITDHTNSAAVGEIIVFVNKNHLTAHRIIEILEGTNGERSYITRGDASDAGTETVPFSDVIGKVLAYEKNCYAETKIERG